MYFYALCTACIIIIVILIDFAFVWLYVKHMKSIMKKLKGVAFILSIIAFFKNDKQ